MTTDLRSLLNIVLSTCFLLVAGCSTSAPLESSFSSAAGTEAITDSLSEYRLGVSDRLKITVYGEPQLSAEYVVNERGHISLALVGDIPAAGMTLAEFQNSLRSHLANGFLQDPRVSAEITQYRPYYILGEVERPGEFPYSGDLSVLKAVAIAGGFTYRANKSVVFIKRADRANEQKLRLTQDMRVYPGDIIRIGERFF